jgi:hypothetical protein
VYIEPCANAAMELELVAMVLPLQALAWGTKLLVLSSWQAQVPLMESDLLKYPMVNIKLCILYRLLTFYKQNISHLSILFSNSVWLKMVVDC